MDEWISVETRLPEKFQNVIGYNKARDEFYTGRYVSLSQNSIGIKTDVPYYNEMTDEFVKAVMFVTHWQPCPSAVVHVIDATGGTG